ncbi:MAG: type II toxin-antitoxin system RelE/ParE family toxin [Propionibacteriaceae bacterium]|nr:type II toxin-antitoxin system RelE/ParE family toxin [Propionibacteriaceae bacterium]
MTSYHLTPAARRDLSSIWDFTEERWGVEQAETYVAEIRAAIERITADPRRGGACAEIREGYRRYSIGSHTCFSISTVPMAWM